MSHISSINFKKSIVINTEHNDRTLAPSYLISNIGCEYNRNSQEARALKNEIITRAMQAYTKRTGQKSQAKSYEWSAVCNIKETTKMQDLERLAKHFNSKYGFQCYQIAIHRDEGHINEQGQKVINHHAHLEFITLDKDTGKNMWRREFISPKVLREMQSEVAEILQMQRGQDKRLSGAKRVEPRIYARMKEQEKKALQSIKKELLTQNYENEIKMLRAENIELKKENIDLQQNFIDRIKEVIDFKNRLDSLCNTIEQEISKFSTLESNPKIVKEIENNIDELNDFVKNNLHFEEFFSFEKYRNVNKNIKQWIQEIETFLNK